MRRRSCVKRIEVKVVCLLACVLLVFLFVCLFVCLFCYRQTNKQTQANKQTVLVVWPIARATSKRAEKEGSKETK